MRSKKALPAWIGRMNSLNKIVQAFKAIFENQAASYFLLLLILGDAIFIFFHYLLHMTPVLENMLFSIGTDMGYAEFFLYTQEFWIVILLLAVSIKAKSAGYILWSALFEYLLFDDAMMLHELWGAEIARTLSFQPAFGLRPQDFGELFISVSVFAVFISLLIISYVRGNETFRRSSRHLLFLLLVLVFFGVIVDMTASMLNLDYYLHGAVAAIENGGEMLAMSLITWYAFLLAIKKGDSGIIMRRFI